MAEFLTTTGTSHHIEQIIIKAKDTLTLVTPYLKLSRTLTERLIDADRNGVRITLIYGKSELGKSENERLSALKNLELWFCENLHAKCYHNEDSMIITSMNLYEFSEKNNREMGILINKEKDVKIFEDTVREISSIKNASEKKKTTKTARITNYDNLITLPNHINSEEEFYLPSLYKIISEKYPEYNILYNDLIIIEDFPGKDTLVEISYRVEVYTKDREKESFDYFAYDHTSVRLKLPQIQLVRIHRTVKRVIVFCN